MGVTVLQSGVRSTAILVFALLGCSGSDDGGTNGGSSGVPGSGGAASGGAGGSSSGGSNVGGAAAGSGAAGDPGVAGAGGSASGGTAGSGGWAGGTPGTVIVDDPTLARTWPAAHGEAMISLWSGDALGALTITIDDNTQPDHAWWTAQAQTYGLRLTWFVITDNVKGGYGGTWAGFAQLVAAGHDVQSHTVTHLTGNLSIDQEYQQSQNAIEQNLPGVRAITLAYPGGTNSSLNSQTVAAKYYVGARGTVGQQNPIGATNYMNVNSVSGTITLATDHWAGLPNVVVKNPAHAKSFRAWHCIHYHLLTQGGKTNALAGFQWIQGHFGDLFVGLFRETLLYARERDSATLTVPSVSPNQIVIDLKHSLSDALFDQPLTIKVGLDASWSSATASQAGAATPVKVIQYGGKPFALVEAVPDRGPVIITSG